MSDEKSFLTREEAEDFAGKSGTVTPVGTAFVAVKGGKADKADDKATAKEAAEDAADKAAAETKPSDIKSEAKPGNATTTSK